MIKATEQVDGCPCGLSGGECKDLVYPLTNESGALRILCSQQGSEQCLVTEEEAFCDCRCGYEGDLCEEPIKALTSNFILGFIFIIVGSLICIQFLRKFKNQMKPNKHEYKRIDFVTSDVKWISPSMILIYRASMVLIFFPVIFAIFSDGFVQIKYFSNLTFIMFGIMFIIGTFLSARSLIYGSNASDLTTNLEKTFLFLFEMQLPSATILSLVVWIIIYPSTEEEDLEEHVLNPKLYMIHGINVILVLIEGFFNKLYFESHHAIYLLLIIFGYEGFFLIVQAWDSINGYGHCPFYGFQDMSTQFFMPIQVAVFLMFAAGFYLFYLLSEYKAKYREFRVESK